MSYLKMFYKTCRCLAPEPTAYKFVIERYAKLRIASMFWKYKELQGYFFYNIAKIQN